jgi:hypothetical protein
MFHDGTIGELCDSVDSMLIGLARFGDPCRDDGKIYYAALKRIDAENPPDADAQRQRAELDRDRNRKRAIDSLSGALATVKAAAESNTGELRDELRALHTAIENVRKPLEDWLLAMIASTGSRGSASTNGKRDKELVEWEGKANAAIQRALPVSQRIREWHGSKIPHPPLMLMRELNNLQILGSNSSLFRKLKADRDGHAAMRMQFLGILKNSANERANRFIREGGKRLDALGEFAACDEWAATPPQPDNPELVEILRDNLERQQQCVKRARHAIREGGAKVLDSATKPNAAGQPRSIELNITMQDAEKVLSGMMIGIANPQFSIDKGIEDLIDLHGRFNRAHDELGAVVETVGLTAPESAKAGSIAPKRKRKRPVATRQRPMTVLETRTLEVVGRHRGNYAKAARELNRDPKTVRENYERAFEKAHGMLNTRSVKATRLPTDSRGNQDVEDEDGG